MHVIFLMQLPDADNFCHVICLSRFINCINLLEEKNIVIKFELVLVNINLFNCIPPIIRHGFYQKPWPMTLNSLQHLFHKRIKLNNIFSGRLSPFWLYICSCFTYHSWPYNINSMMQAWPYSTPRLARLIHLGWFDSY